jgi:hypothetical protein
MIEDNILFDSFQEDISLSGYKKHLVAQHAPAPLTNAEEEIKYIKKNEVFLIFIRHLSVLTILLIVPLVSSNFFCFQDRFHFLHNCIKD